MTDNPFRRLFYSFSRFDYYNEKPEVVKTSGIVVCVIFRYVLPYDKTERILRL